MSIGSRVAALGAVLVTANAAAAPPALAPNVTPLEPGAEPHASPPARETSASEREGRSRAGDRWSLLLEGVAHAPSDIGGQIGVETPSRVRLFTGFGYMPIEWLTSFAAGATNDSDAALVLELPSYDGTVWRAQLGVRPFPRLGFYIDAGYARATLRGSVDLDDSLLAREEGLEGAYSVRSYLDMWLIELGHEWRVAGRGILALGGGVMRTFNANTTIKATGGAPGSSRFPEGAERANEALERYGTIPMLTLRAGVDLI